MTVSKSRYKENEQNKNMFEFSFQLYELHRKEPHNYEYYCYVIYLRFT